MLGPVFILAPLREERSVRCSNRIGFFVAIFCIFALQPPPSAATVRYAARYEQDCHLCHTNPTGGGQRTLYASQFLAPTELAAKWLRFEDLESISPQVSESILVGVDLRTLYNAWEQDPAEPVDNFFQMQSDLYVSIQMGERYSLYLDRGSSGSTESFGMAHVLPANGYVKVGQFTPAFGWRFVDHTLATRRFLGYFPGRPGATDVGVEMGFYPGRTTVQLAVLNGSPGADFDGDESLMVQGRAVQRFRVGPLALALGGSARHQRQGGRDQIAAGGFGSASIGPLVWTGEVDWLDASLDLPEGKALASSHELAVRVVQGVDLLGTYSFYDPHLDFLTGAHQRFGFGVDALVSPFMGVRAMVQLHRNDPYVSANPSRTVPEDYNEALVVFHFLY
jgi:hypothetical protein